MPVGGVGGALLQLSGGGDLQRQLAAGLSPPVTPQPSPAAQGAPGTVAPGPGGGGQPGGAQGQPGAPPQVYGPDPVNAQNMGALLQLAQREENARSFNQAMYGIGASFGTKEQQQSNMANAARMGGGGGGDILGDIRQAQGIEQTARDQWYQGRFMAGAAGMGGILGTTPEVAQELALSGKLPEVLQTHFSQLGPTEAIKNYTQAREILKQRGLSDAQVDALMPPETLMLGPGATLDERQYLQYSMNEKAAGRTPAPFDTWKAQLATQAKVATDKAMDIENAGKALPDVNRQLDDVESKVREIMADPNLPSILGKVTPTNPDNPLSLLTATDAQRALAKKIANLLSTNYAEGFKIGGASRKTQFELGQLSSALSGSVGSTNLSESDYRNGLLEFLNKARVSHANAYGEAQQYGDMPSNLNGYLDPMYRQGGSWAGSGAPGPLKQPSDEDKKDFDTIAGKYGRQAAVMHFRENGIDVRGL